MKTICTRLGLVLLGLVVAASGALTATGADRSPAAVSLTPAADVSQFNPGNLISNSVFFDGNAMGAAEIQAFISVKGTSCVTGSDGTPCLKDFRQDTTARGADAYCAGYAPAAQETAGTIIAKVAQSCGISARVLLVMMQKEQSLVTTVGGRGLTASRYQKTMGFACPDTAACDAAYFGFQNQVYSAARQFQRYAASPNSFGYRAGRSNNILYNPNSACGSSSVYIQNQATANLYNYTPYQPNSAAMAAGYGSGDSCSAYGNRNFWLYFTDWFGSTQEPGVTASMPVGSFDGVGSSYGTVTVNGWTYDPDYPPGSLAVHVYVDGTFAAAAQAGLSRPDVAAVHPAAGAAHGFSVNFVPTVGVHEVCVYAINVGAGTINPQLGCRSVDNQDAGAPVGSLDSAVATPGTVTVNGWVFDPDVTGSEVSVHAYVDGMFAQAFQAAVPRPDVAAIHSVPVNRGYAQQITTSPGLRSVCLYAINMGLGTHNTSLGCASLVVPDPAAYNPRGTLERATASGGTVRVGGWVFDPDAPLAPTTTHLYIDGTFVDQITTSSPRPDVSAAVTGAGGTTGYVWSGVVAAGRHQVCVYAINVGYGNDNPRLGCQTVTTIGGAAANPVGTVDGATGGPGTVSIGGWAVDPDQEPVPVHVYVDGTFAGATGTNVARPDVARAVAGATATAGYNWTGTAAPGTHQVCAYAINVGVGTGNPGLGCRTVVVTDPAVLSNPIGSVDGVGASVGAFTVGGWAYDTDIPTSPVSVHVYLDDVFAFAVQAGDPRPDIADAIPGAGPAHGYNGAGAASSGLHRVCVYAINVGPGTANTGLGCRVVVVP